MMNLKQIENMIRSKRSNTDYAAAYEAMFLHFSFIDSYYHTNHCQVLNELYKDIKLRQKLSAVAMKTNLSDSSLLRNRKLYVACFNFYLKHISRAESEAAVAEL